MKLAVKIVTILLAVVFIAIGLQWAIIPAEAGAPLGYSIPTGLGLSSMLGDVGGFFTGGGIMMVLGLKTKNAAWFQAAAMLVGLAAIFRVIAWGAHGAPFAGQFILLEVFMAVVLLLAANKLCGEES